MPLGRMSIKFRAERVRSGAMEALEKITGQPLGVDEAQWRKWWEQNKARYPTGPENGK